MAVDWLKIKTEYINGDISYRKLSEKYGVPLRTIAKHAKDENWQHKKEQARNRLAMDLQQKTIEKTSEALSDEAAAKVRIRSSMMRLAEGWFANQERFIMEDPERRGINPSDFRKMVQSCVDLGIMEVQDPDENESDGLLDALAKSAASLFDGGDDSGMILEDEE